MSGIFIGGGGGGGDMTKAVYDINEDSVIDLGALTELTQDKIWQGNPSGRPVEVAMPSAGYTVNKETMTGDKTLSAGDPQIQILDPGAASRTVTLPTTGNTNGDEFLFINNDGDNVPVYTITIASPISKVLTSGMNIRCFYNGTAWEIIEYGINLIDGTIRFNDNSSSNILDDSVAIGKGAMEAVTRAVSIGHTAKANTNSVGIGYYADANTKGVGIGYYSNTDYGVAIGWTAQGAAGVTLGYNATGDGNYPISIGYYADSNAKNYSIALGENVTAQRTYELARRGNSDNHYVTYPIWTKRTINNTPIEMFLGSTSERWTVLASSVVYFDIMVSARDISNSEVAAYRITGVIKRDGSNNTTLSQSTVTAVHEDDATWDIGVTADDTNEALKLTVTGDNTNNVDWTAHGRMVETRYA